MIDSIASSRFVSSPHQMHDENDTFEVSGFLFQPSTFFLSHFSLLFTTSHSSHMLKFMTSFRSHEIKSLGFIFLPAFFQLISPTLLLSRSHTFARVGILSLPDCFHRLSYCEPFPYICSVVFFCTLFVWSIFWRELSLLLLFIFKRLPNTRFRCARALITVFRKYLDDFMQ